MACVADVACVAVVYMVSGGLNIDLLLWLG